jgi:general secretion pathway protein A
MMPYYQHFGLERDPFLDTADPHFYRSTGNLAHAKNRLVSSIEQSRGLMIVVGDPGTGKTSLAGAVERELLSREKLRLGKILDPSFAGDIEFLVTIGRSFGLAFPPRSPAALKNALKNFFYDTAVVEGSTVALFIDEAQNLSDENLETLRLLLNFDVPERKLLNIVLFGQSEFRDQVNKRRNLADRVAGWVDLSPLTAADVRALLAHRIARAGGASDLSMTFANDALDLIVECSLGTPRRILTITHATLEEAALRGHPRALRVDAETAIRSRGMAIVTVPAAAHNGSVGENGSANGGANGATEDDAPKQRRWPWLAAFRI